MLGNSQSLQFCFFNLRTVGDFLIHRPIWGNFVKIQSFYLVHYLSPNSLGKQRVVPWPKAFLFFSCLLPGFISGRGQRKDEQQGEDDVPYSFGFFHLVFATGAMYFAMLLIGWNSNHPMKKWTIDVGWTSTWVRIVNEWLAVCVYLWMLVAPIVWKNRQVEAPA